MRQRVDMRRRKIGVAVDAQVAPNLVVRQNDDNIRPRPGRPRADQAEHVGIAPAAALRKSSVTKSVCPSWILRSPRTNHGYVSAIRAGEFVQDFQIAVLG